MKEGLSGNIAKAFIQSKLTILLMIAFLLIGGYSTMLIPREEEPQIDVPMADIFLRYPGSIPKRSRGQGITAAGENNLQYKGCRICVLHLHERSGHADRSVLCWRGY